jgi:hypothetical protein
MERDAITENPKATLECWEVGIRWIWDCNLIRRAGECIDWSHLCH